MRMDGPWLRGSIVCGGVLHVRRCIMCVSLCVGGVLWCDDVRAPMHPWRKNGPKKVYKLDVGLADEYNFFF